jgi:hypothetical protein
MFPVLPALPAAEQAPLAEVYQAVYGDKPLHGRLRQPRFPEVTDLAATPRLLVRLSADRYALVTSQDADTMVHIAQGAISIAYVERTPAGWRLRARWDEVAWTGSTGRAATTITAVFAPSRPPRIVVIDNNLIQGQVQVERSTIALDRDGPRLLATVYKDLPPEPIEDR